MLKGVEPENGFIASVTDYLQYLLIHEQSLDTKPVSLQEL